MPTHSSDPKGLSQIAEKKQEFGSHIRRTSMGTSDSTSRNGICWVAG